MALVIAGDKFTARQERDAVIELLKTCDSMYAWQTKTVQTHLIATWD